MPARILVVGAGAIGAFFGARLSTVAAVSALCRSNYDLAKRNGFRVTSPTYGDTLWRPDNVFSCSEQARKASIKWDYLLVTTKALPDVHDDSALLEGLVSPQTSVVLLQNGLGIEQPYRSRFSNNTILSAVTTVSVAQSVPGYIQHNRWTRTSIGPYLPHLDIPASRPRAGDDLANERAVRLVDLLVEAGAKDSFYFDHANLQFIRWHKVAINAAMNPTAVLSGGTDNRTMSTDTDLSKHVLAVMNEVLETAPKVLGRSLPSHLPSPAAVLKSAAGSSPGSKPSMLSDWEQGRKMELEVILGNPIRLARQSGVDMPLLQTMYALLKTAQAKREKSTGKL